MKKYIVSVYFRDIEEALARFGFAGGGTMVEAWTMKGARRRLRKTLAAMKIPNPHQITLDALEVIVDSTTGDVLRIVDREICP